MEAIGFAMSSVDYAIQIAGYLRKTIESYNQNPSACAALLSRFRAVRSSLRHLKKSKHLDLRSQIWGSAFYRIRDHFDKATAELQDIRSTLKTNTIWRLIYAADISKRMKALEDDVDMLQRDLDMLGFFTASNAASANHAFATQSNVHDVQDSINQMEHKLDILAAKIQSDKAQKNRKHRESNSRSLNERTPNTREVSPTSNCDPGGPSASTLLDRVNNIERTVKAFSKISKTVAVSPEERGNVRRELQSLYEKWQINLSDVTVKDNGKFTSSNDTVYKGSVVLRDIQGKVLRVAHAAVKVAQKEACTEEVKLSFLRQVFILRELTHPCILVFYGAYWTKGLKEDMFGVRSKLKIGTNNSAIIVAELMTHNLLTAKREGYLADLKTKLQVLRDIACGLEYIHSKGVVHNSLKPENVLLRVINGTILCNAKLGDIGRYSEIANKPSQRITQNHIPPEAYHGVRDEKPSWDAWSFGSIMCFLLAENDYSLSGSGQREQGCEPSLEGIRPGEITDPKLRSLAEQCLLSRGELRPSSTYIRRFLEFACKEHDPQSIVVFDNGDKLRMVGKEFLYGRNGRSKDAVEAFRYFQEAVQHGNVPALGSLADCFFYGHGTEKNLAEAVRFYRIAANAGHASALFRLGECYCDGSGVEQDSNTALMYLKQAADKHSIPAKFRLGLHYFNNRTSNEDATFAVQLWKEAAMAGHPIAQFRIAACWENGIGLPKDSLLARMWYSKSASAGNLEAKRALERLDQDIRIH